MKTTNASQILSLAAAIAMMASVATANAGTKYEIYDGGPTLTYELADDELAVRALGVAGSKLALDVRSKHATAVVIEEQAGRVVVRFSGGVAQRDAALANLGIAGGEAELVMYPSGAVRSNGMRRILTRDVLVKKTEGVTDEQIKTVAGVGQVKATVAAGYVLINLPSPGAALSTAMKLRAAGISAEPQLARTMEKRGIPNDFYFDQQWHLQNLGQSNGRVGADANVVDLWDFATGGGVVISIVDDGLELDHPDFEGNILPRFIGGEAIHHDFNDNDDEPSPGPFDAHGTSCAGVAAAKGNNVQGGSGAAPDASLLGLRLIAAGFTDMDHARAITWAPADVVVGVSSNSWGPRPGLLLAPGPISKAAFQDAISNGRDGKGVVFVWAAGNSRQESDNANLDGYGNSRFVIDVGAFDNRGQQSSYSENGAPLLVCAPSSGGTLGIFTTDVTGDGGYNRDGLPPEAPDADYTNSFGGTSSACPLVAGIVADILEINPDLGYRDVQEIIASTAKLVNPTDLDWVNNEAGFKFSHRYGGGLIDGVVAGIRAETWENLDPEVALTKNLTGSTVPVNIPEGTPDGLARNFDFTGEQNIRVEHVEVVLDINHTHRSDLEILLTSPAGTVSRLIEKRPRPAFESDVNYKDGTDGWTFTSTHHWGENSSGTWVVTLNDKTAGTTGSLRSGRINLYGTPDGNQRVSFASTFTNISEADGTGTFTVSRLGGTTGTVTVDYAASLRSTATAADFVLAPGTLTFGDGETSKAITVTLIDDAVANDDPNLYVVLTNPVGASLGGRTVATMEIDDDEGNVVFVTATDASSSETTASQVADTGTFTISRSIVDDTALTVIFSVSGTATEVDDYKGLQRSVTIPPNQASATVLLTPRNDKIVEGSETVEIAVEPDPAYNLGFPRSAFVEIVDNDLVPINIEASVSAVMENSAQPVIFTVSREGADASYPLLVNVFVGGSAVEGVDYDPPFPKQILLEIGEGSKTMTVVPNDNPKFNPPRTIIVGVSQSVNYKEGFFRSAEVRILDNDPLPDVKDPTVAITSPLNKARINAPDSITATGSFADNIGVTVVQYRVNQQGWRIATMDTVAGTWSGDITKDLNLGPNFLEARAFDDDNNTSVVPGVLFDYVKERNLTVSINGPGSVSTGFLGTTTREVGQTYTIIARPGRGLNLFAGWTGGITSSSKSLSFAMPDADLSLTAEFLASQLDLNVTGTYVGLVERAPFNHSTSGYLDIHINQLGVFTGTLTYGGTRAPIRGEFTALGQYSGAVNRKKNSPLFVTLSLDVSPSGTQTVTGTVNADGTVSGVSLNRAVFHPKNNPVTGVVGTHTFQIAPADLLAPALPNGFGWATMKIKPSGAVTWSGMLPDGTRASQSTQLSKDLTWPLFATPHKGGGVILGEVAHDPLATGSDFTAALDWMKVPRQTDKLFPLGFVIEDMELTGSAYLKPASGQRILSSFNTSNGAGTILLASGNLPADIIKTLIVNEQNQVSIVPDDDKLNVKFSLGTGAFSGSFVHRVTGKKQKLSGVVLQKAEVATGQFEGSTFSGTALQTGNVTIEATVVP